MQKIHNLTHKKELAKAKERQLKKITRFHVKKHGEQAGTPPQTTDSTDKSKWIINFSSYNINKDERIELPGKGMNLSITPTTIPALDLVAKIETVHDIKT